MKFIIDTHILIRWMLDLPELSQQHVMLLEETEKEGDSFGISIITEWEIAKLVERGKFKFEINQPLEAWFEKLNQNSYLNVLPLNSSIILDSTRLGKNFPKDPADQLIAATARYHGIPLMTMDDRIQKSGVVALV